MSPRLPFRRRAVPVPAAVLEAARLGRGERVLTGAESAEGTWLLGTRDALLLVTPGPHAPAPAATAGAPEPRRIPWQWVERADWDREEDRLVVTEVGEFGEVRPVHRFTVAEPGLLLDLVRERVTASVVLQRRVDLGGGRGLFVVARRPPRANVGMADLAWAFEFDEDVDPDDPSVREAAERALTAAREELGA